MGSVLIDNDGRGKGGCWIIRRRAVLGSQRGAATLQIGTRPLGGGGGSQPSMRQERPNIAAHPCSTKEGWWVVGEEEAHSGPWWAAHRRERERLTCPQECRSPQYYCVAHISTQSLRCALPSSTSCSREGGKRETGLHALSGGISICHCMNSTRNSVLSWCYDRKRCSLKELLNGKVAESTRQGKYLEYFCGDCDLGPR